MMENTVWIGITGGPCAGKTSVLSFLSQKLSDYGLDVYTTREAATLVMEMGAKLKKAIRDGDPRKIREYQKMIMRCTMDIEAWVSRFALIEGRRAVVLCDRPVPDSRAYLSEGLAGDLEYQSLLNECGSSLETALETYQGVIKLTTAADGALPFYTLANNTARDETPEEAIALDRRIEEAYNGHGHFRVVDNSTDFDGKKMRVLQHVCHMLGIPVPVEIERKYLIDIPALDRFSVKHRTVLIEQTYLSPPDAKEEIRVRRRSMGDAATHYLTRKIFIETGKRTEIEDRISERAYQDMTNGRQPDIRKKRTCFLWDSQYFELDVFERPAKQWAILEIELTDINDSVTLPPFINVIREVTDDPAYSNRRLAIAV